VTDITEQLMNVSFADPDYALYRKAADEIGRLRAALESLTADPPSTLDEPDEDWEVIVKMRAIARAALDAGTLTAEERT
jgi:hypothetical protein